MKRDFIVYTEIRKTKQIYDLISEEYKTLYEEVGYTSCQFEGTPKSSC